MIERYVTATGGGAHDGTSEANAWTWAQMVAVDKTAGDFHVNIKSGTYSRSASDTLSAGIVTLPNIYEGYATTPSDLRDIPRDSEGHGWLHADDYPYIQYANTYKLTVGAYCVLWCLFIVCSLNGDALTTGTNTNLIKCLVGNSRSVNGTTQVWVCTQAVAIDCDFYDNSNGGPTMVVGEMSLTRCHFTGHSSCYGVYGSRISLRECVFIGINTIIYPSSAAILLDIRNCSAYDLLNVVQKYNGGMWVIEGLVAYSTKTGSTFISGTAVGGCTVNDNAVKAASADTGVGNYISYNRITLTENPFNDVDYEDLSLNTAAGGGALCKGVAPDGGDLGAFQSGSGSSPAPAKIITFFG